MSKTNLGAPISDFVIPRADGVSQPEHGNEHLLHHRCGGRDNSSRRLFRPASIALRNDDLHLVKGKRNEQLQRFMRDSGEVAKRASEIITLAASQPRERRERKG
jgi:hypothetical protein